MNILTIFSQKDVCIQYLLDFLLKVYENTDTMDEIVVYFKEV